MKVSPGDDDCCAISVAIHQHHPHQQSHGTSEGFVEFLGGGVKETWGLFVGLRNRKKPAHFVIPIISAKQAELVSQWVSEF